MKYMYYMLYLYASKLTCYAKNLRILGGSDATIQQYPYVARLEVFETLMTAKGILENRANIYHQCTCSILKPSWTLTAAHCIIDLIIQGKSKKQPTVKGYIRYGHVMDFVNKTSKVKTYIIHPGYRSFSEKHGGIIQMHNDIGLMQTDAIVITKYAKLSGIDYSTFIGEEAVATGFGIIKKGMNTLHLRKPLQVLTVVVVKCGYLDLYPALCTAAKCGSKEAVICGGDSGGPLIHSSGVIGVNSLSVSVDCLPIPLIMTSSIVDVTPISPYLSWINFIVNH